MALLHKLTKELHKGVLGIRRADAQSRPDRLTAAIGSCGSPGDATWYYMGRRSDALRRSACFQRSSNARARR
jgi:hypothetical protein